jgi:hypothetical protein
VENPSSPEVGSGHRRDVAAVSDSPASCAPRAPDVPDFLPSAERAVGAPPGSEVERRGVEHVGELD